MSFVIKESSGAEILRVDGCCFTNSQMRVLNGCRGLDQIFVIQWTGK